MISKLMPLLDELKFKGMALVIDEVLARAQREALPVEEVLRILFTQEHHYRQERSLDYRIKQAHLPCQWTMETFPFAQQPSVDKGRLLSLAGLDFLTRGENLVFIGPPYGENGAGHGDLPQGVAQWPPCPVLQCSRPTRRALCIPGRSHNAPAP